jgi:hypothetical protein
VGASRLIAEQTYEQAPCAFYPSITLYIALEHGFSVTIGRHEKIERSDKLRDLRQQVIKQIVEQELVPLFPEGFWWDTVQTAHVSVLGYQDTVKGFTVKVYVPVTPENEDWAVWMIMSGKARSETTKPAP